MSDLEAALIGQLRFIDGPPYVREYQFAKHLGRRWRFDLCWPDLKLAVEVEGGSWVNGAHTRGRHFESDCEKYNEAAILGWRVLRLTTDMVTSGKSVDFILRALDAC
jgi:very-short-patch-repair endonuclease